MDKKKGLSLEEIHRIQIEEILKHKWIKSEECGRDLGDEAVKDWVDKHAADFREYWERKCRGLNDEGAVEAIIEEAFYEMGQVQVRGK